MEYNNYIPLEKISLRYKYFCFIDTKEYLADALLIWVSKVRFGNVPSSRTFDTQINSYKFKKGDCMKDFLEQTLRQSVSIVETEYLNDKLPLAYRGRYIFYKVETNGLSWIAIRPKNDASLVMLRKDRAKIEKVAGLNCAIFLDSTTFYIKEKLV